MPISTALTSVLQLASAFHSGATHIDEAPDFALAKDRLSSLPAEVQSNILKHVELEGRASLRKTSTFWRDWVTPEEKSERLRHVVAKMDAAERAGELEPTHDNFHTAFYKYPEVNETDSPRIDALIEKIPRMEPDQQWKAYTWTAQNWLKYTPPQRETLFDGGRQVQFKRASVLNSMGQNPDWLSKTHLDGWADDVMKLAEHERPDTLTTRGVSRLPDDVHARLRADGKKMKDRNSRKLFLDRLGPARKSADGSTATGLLKRLHIG
jgi:F-box associated protein